MGTGLDLTSRRMQIVRSTPHPPGCPEIFGLPTPEDEGATISTDIDQDATIALSLILEEKGHSVLSFEIDEIDAGGAFVELQPHPRRPGRPLPPGAHLHAELKKRREK